MANSHIHSAANLNLNSAKGDSNEVKKLKQSLERKTVELDMVKIELEQMKNYAKTKGIDGVDNCQAMNTDIISSSNKGSFRNFQSLLNKEDSNQKEPLSTKNQTSSMRGLFDHKNFDTVNEQATENASIEDKYYSMAQENLHLKDTVNQMEQKICELLHIEAVTSRTNRTNKKDQNHKINESCDTVDLDPECIEKRLREDNFELKTKIIKLEEK